MIVSRPRVQAPLSPVLRAAFVRLIEERVGIRLSDQQERNFGEVLAAMLAAAGEDLIPDDLYIIFRRGGRADLFAALTARLVIGETHFFRVAPQIAALRDVVLPGLIASRASQRRLNLWSAGCSSGEEPYTLAILLRELLPAAEGWQLRLLATDLSAPSLDAARRARYRDWSFRETPERIRRRYFAREGDTWQLEAAIRAMVQFAPHNLIADPFPAPGLGSSAFDLILCRNVTIYFSPAVTERLYRRFADTLAPGGWLVLGPSDPTPPTDCFAPNYLSGAILWRKLEAPAPAPVPPARPPVPTGPIAASREVRVDVPLRAGVPAPRADQSPRPVAPPPVAPPRTGLGEVRALLRGGSREAARERLADLAREDPLSVATHRLQGLLALEDGEPDAALASLRRATFLDADDPLAQFGLGRVYRALGDENRARAAFRHARRLIASWPGDRPIPGDDGLSAEDLRGGLDAQLATIGEPWKAGV
ncbi:MAG: CheR family methyltransferase [Thermomicrobiales bacterium]